MSLFIKYAPLSRRIPVFKRYIHYPPSTITEATTSTIQGNVNKRVIALPTKVNEMKLRCTEFDRDGSVKMTAGEFLKLTFAILVNIAHLKALLKSELVVLFDTFGSTDSYNQSLFIYDLEERLKSSKDGLPFEFRALEAILISVTSSLQSELDVLEGPVNKILADLEELADIEESMNGDKLRDLLKYSKKLAQFEQDALSIRDALEEVLDNDEDLAAMYLTDKEKGKHRESQDHEEVELLLEAYYKQTEEIAAKASTLRQHMRSTEEIVQLILDVSRNSLMWYDIRLTIITLSATIVSGYGALFGMNLRNYFEDDPYAFGIISGVALVSGTGAFAIALKKLRSLAKIKRC
ncbi:unnamed protein product [Rhizopus stolonifer]